MRTCRGILTILAFAVAVTKSTGTDPPVSTAPKAASESSNRLVINRFNVLDPGAVHIEWSQLGDPFRYTIEYSDGSAPFVWVPVEPSTQWPTAENRWTGRLSTTSQSVFLRISAETTVQPLSAPVITSALYDGNRLELNWVPMPDALSYQLFWYRDSNAQPAQVETVSSGTAQSSIFTPTDGLYALRARTAQGDTPFSQKVSVGPMPSLSGIVEAQRRRSAYHLDLRRADGFRYAANVDGNSGRQHVVIQGAEPTVQLEVVSESTNSWAHLVGNSQWLRVQHKDYAAYLDSIMASLSQPGMVAVRADGPDWVVGIKSQLLWTDAQVGEIWEAFVDRWEPAARERMLPHLMVASRDLSVSVEIRVSQESQLVASQQIIVQNFEGTLGGYSLSWTDLTAPVPPRPETFGTIDEPPFAEILLLPVRSLGGWCGGTHCGLAQETLNIIRKLDTQGAFGEVYSPALSSASWTSGTPQPNQHHPLVIGANFEDNHQPMPQFYDVWFAADPMFKNDTSYYWNHNGFPRDYHHFGDGVSVGLEYKTWFSLRPYFDNSPPPPPRPKPGDRYYDLSEWAFGYPRTSFPNQINRLSFSSAIDQYNLYTGQGKTNAYLMMGHVLHLLQDSGHPDHARAYAHPGSGNRGSDVKNICGIVAAEAAIYVSPFCCSWCSGTLLGYLICVGACEAAASGVAYGACRGLFCDSCRGYELLAEELWSPTRITGPTVATGVISRPDFNQYFAEMAKITRDTFDKAKMDSVVGCDDFVLAVPPFWTVDGLIPAIPDDQDEIETYLRITDSICTTNVCYSAGLLQHFYSLVNHPPVLERVAVVQWEPNVVPSEFGLFPSDPAATNPCTIYDTEWVTDVTNKIRQPQSLIAGPKLYCNTDRPIYIFLLFGPSSIGPDFGGLVMSSVDLRMTGTDPMTGTPIDETVALTRSSDSTHGVYYWGSYQPTNCGDDPYTLTLNVRASDKTAHFSGRTPRGNELDQEPASLAIVQPVTQPSYFPWAGYEPGVDTKHKVSIQIARFEAVAEPDQVELSSRLSATAESELTVTQMAQQCNTEPYQRPTKCDVRWELPATVTRLGRVPQSDTPESFGLSLELLPGRISAQATLIIRHARERYTPGEYEIAVSYFIGDRGSPRGRMLTVSLLAL